MAELSELQPDGGNLLRLAEDEVHIWYIQATADTLDLCQSPLATCLSPAEAARYHSLKLASVRQNFLLSRGCLRHVLSRYVAMPPGAFKFAFGAYGKPALATSREQPALQFNLSHSQDRLAIALHAQRPLGLDLEYLRPITHLARLCQRCLTANEASTVLSLAPHQANRRFLQYWTVKEAVLKSLGVGLSQPMDQIEIFLGNQEVSSQPVPLPRASIMSIDSPPPSGPLQLYQWQPEPNYLAALAIQGGLSNPLPKIILKQITPWALVKEYPAAP